MPAEITDRDLLTREQAAAYLGLKSRTLATWKSKGRYRLPFVLIGQRCVRYRMSDLRAFVERFHQAPDDPAEPTAEPSPRQPRPRRARAS